MFITSLDKSYSAKLSQNHEFLFQIFARPAPKIKFYKDNKELMLKDRIQLFTETKGDVYNYKLLISSAQASDSGSYKVEASNKCATLSDQFQLTVIGTLLSLITETLMRKSLIDLIQDSPH